MTWGNQQLIEVGRSKSCDDIDGEEIPHGTLIESEADTRKQRSTSHLKPDEFIYFLARGSKATFGVNLEQKLKN